MFKLIAFFSSFFLHTQQKKMVRFLRGMSKYASIKRSFSPFLQRKWGLEMRYSCLCVCDQMSCIIFQVFAIFRFILQGQTPFSSHLIPFFILRWRKNRCSSVRMVCSFFQFPISFSALFFKLFRGCQNSHFHWQFSDNLHDISLISFFIHFVF